MVDRDRAPDNRTLPAGVYAGQTSRQAGVAWKRYRETGDAQVLVNAGIWAPINDRERREKAKADAGQLRS